MLLQIHPDNPDPRKIEKVVDCLSKGGVVIFPTDTVYSIGCDLTRPKALERVAKIKGLKPEEADMSVLCRDLSELAQFSKPLDNHIYKLMKRALPGPYTFILNASSNVPKLFRPNKKTIGIRVPDNNIVSEVIRILGNPIVGTSVKDDDEIIEYTTDPELIFEKYGHLVDIVIHGGFGGMEPSTVIDCTGSEALVVREGKGPVDWLL